MSQTVQELRESFQRAFGSSFTAEQLWVLVGFAKRVRLRARNNSAFNNLCNELFPGAHFKQVDKYRADGSSYKGLVIEVNGQVVEGEDE